MIHVVIADDHHLVRKGIRALLERETEIEVIGEAADGREAVEMVQAVQPEVAIIDINMPGLNGIEVARKIRESKVPTQVVILSMYSDQSLVNKAFLNGAKGYVLKKSIPSELMLAINASVQKKAYVSSELIGVINPETDYPILDYQEPLSRLTPREREVYQLIAEGFTSARIAEQFNISVKTVEKHRANLMSKLGIGDMASLMREAIRQGLIFVEKYEAK